MNKVLLVGRLTRDPELRTTTSGMAVTRFTVAVSEPYTNRKVIIINKEVDENYYLIPYKTIDNYSLMKCFNPKKVYIDGLGERNDVSVGVVSKKFNGYRCLLNYGLMEE